MKIILKSRLLVIVVETCCIDWAGRLESDSRNPFLEQTGTLDKVRDREKTTVALRISMILIGKLFDE